MLSFLCVKNYEFVCKNCKQWIQLKTIKNSSYKKISRSLSFLCLLILFIYFRLINLFTKWIPIQYSYIVYYSILQYSYIVYSIPVQQTCEVRGIYRVKYTYRGCRVLSLPIVPTTTLCFYRQNERTITSFFIIRIKCIHLVQIKNDSRPHQTLDFVPSPCKPTGSFSSITAISL